MNFDGYEENSNLKISRDILVDNLNKKGFKCNKLEKNGFQLKSGNKTIEIRFTNKDLYKYNIFKTNVQKNIYQINNINYYELLINPNHISWITTFLNEIYNLFA